MTSYAEYLKQQRPPCWGRATAYDPNDEECRGCRYEHSCRSKIQTEDRSYAGSSFPRTNVPIRTNKEERDTDIAAPVEYKANFIEKANAEVVPEGQSPAERFIKDGATGALRGLFGEFYSFFKRYRIP